MKLPAVIYKVKNKLIAWFSDIRIYVGGIILFGESHYAIKGPHTRQVLDVLKPGDVLLRKYKHYLGSMLIPGYWSHAAIYIGDNQVVHMLGCGITNEDILTFLRCDDVMVIRCIDEARIESAIKEAFNYLHKGIGYDYEFDFEDTKEMSCTEFIDVCYGRLEYKSKFINKLILPDDLLGSMFKVVWKKG